MYITHALVNKRLSVSTQFPWFLPQYYTTSNTGTSRPA